MSTGTETTGGRAPGVDPKVIAAIGSAQRPTPAGPLSASLTFGHRALLKIKHVPEQLFDVTMFPLLFTLMFTFIFGGAISGSWQEYRDYLAPGILCQTVVMITMYTAMTINTDVEKGFFDRVRALPVWRPALIVGALLGDALRYTMASAVILGALAVLGYRPGGGLVGLVLAVGLLLIFCFSLSWIWTLLGLKLRTQNAVMGVSMMVLFPLSFLSPVFVSPETMPGWLEAAVRLNPISPLVDAARGFMDGAADGGAVLTVLLVSAGLLAIFGPLTMRTYANKS